MPAIDWNYLSFLSALVLFIIYFKNRNNYEWFFTCDYLFSLTLVIVTLVNRYSKTTNFYITILSLLILTAALIIQIRGRHLYRKYNNLIDYEKRNARRKKAFKIISIIIIIMFIINIFDKIQKALF